jgi:hypothetical protein
VLFGLLALAMLFHATWSVPEAMKPDFYPSRAGAMRVGAILALPLVAALVIEVVGFRLTMLAFNLGMMGVFGRRGWIETGLVAVASPKSNGATKNVASVCIVTSTQPCRDRRDA